MSTITLQEKVLAHLNAFKHVRVEDDRYVPQEITQDGIASALNISRPHVSQILADLVSKGDVEVFYGYANGAARPVKRKVYHLSVSGIRRYETVREKMIRMGVDVDRFGVNFNNCSTDEYLKLSREDRDMFGCLCVLRIRV